MPDDTVPTSPHDYQQGRSVLGQPNLKTKQEKTRKSLQKKVGGKSKIIPKYYCVRIEEKVSPLVPQARGMPALIAHAGSPQGLGTPVSRLATNYYQHCA